MRHLYLLIGTFLLLSIHTHAQLLQLTQNAQVSVLTVEPGNELVDSFGHSAFRVRDPFLSVDYVFNYGRYDFNTPNFYGKFAQGKLLYDLGISRYDNFVYGYQQQNRTIVEQILNLSKEEKQRFFEFLLNNARPENKSYLYDFFFDNCATKLRDVSDEILKDSITFNYTFNETNLTFRDLIHNYLDKQPWGKFGIDLALGSVIDRKATPEEYLFLPDYVYRGYEKGTINGKPLVRITRTLFESKPTNVKTLLLTPIVLFSILALLILWITYKDYKFQRRSKWLDFSLFFFTGFIGLIVLLLWLATDHTATQQNYNVLWAFFPNLIVAFFVIKSELKPWLRSYLKILIVLLLLLLILWLLKIQVFSMAVLPLFLILLIRYLFLYRQILKSRHS